MHLPQDSCKCFYRKLVGHLITILVESKVVQLCVLAAAYLKVGAALRSSCVSIAVRVQSVLRS